MVMGRRRPAAQRAPTISCLSEGARAGPGKTRCLHSRAEMGPPTSASPSGPVVERAGDIAGLLTNLEEATQVVLVIKETKLAFLDAEIPRPALPNHGA